MKKFISLRLISRRRYATAFVEKSRNASRRCFQRLNDRHLRQPEREKSACTKYIQRGFTSRSLSWKGYAPARGRLRAQSKKKNAIRSRSGRWVAPRSPFLSRNYEIASLKDPLRASARSLLSIFFSLIGVVTHRRPSLSRSSYRRRRLLFVLLPPSLALLFPSASSQNRQRIIPSSLLTIGLLSSSPFLSFAAPNASLPTLLAFLFQIASSSSRSPRREIDPVSLRLPRQVILTPGRSCRTTSSSGTAVAARRSGVHDRCPNSGIDTAPLVYLRVDGPSLVAYEPGAFVRREQRL